MCCNIDRNSVAITVSAISKHSKSHCEEATLCVAAVAISRKRTYKQGCFPADPHVAT